MEIRTLLLLRAPELACRAPGRGPLEGAPPLSSAPRNARRALKIFSFFGAARRIQLGLSQPSPSASVSPRRLADASLCQGRLADASLPKKTPLKHPLRVVSRARSQTRPNTAGRALAICQCVCESVCLALSKAVGLTRLSNGNWQRAKTALAKLFQSF